MKWIRVTNIKGYEQLVLSEHIVTVKAEEESCRITVILPCIDDIETFFVEESIDCIERKLKEVS